MKERVNKGSQKKYPSDQFTRNEWALRCSRFKYGAIPTNIVNISRGEFAAAFPSRRQARKNKHKYPGYKLVNA